MHGLWRKINARSPASGSRKSSVLVLGRIIVDMFRIAPYLVVSLFLASSGYAQFFIPGTQHIVSNADLFVPAGGSRSAIASNGSEFLGVWTQGLSQFAVRLDAMGRPLDASGIPLRIASSYYGETPLLTGAGGNFILVLAQSVSLLDRDARVLRRVGMGTPGVPLTALSDGRSLLVAYSSVSAIFVRLLATDATPITDWTTIGSTFDLSVEREAAFGVDSNGYVAFLATKNGLTMQRISSRGWMSSSSRFLSVRPLRYGDAGWPARAGPGRAACESPPSAPGPQRRSRSGDLMR